MMVWISPWNNSMGDSKDAVMKTDFTGKLSWWSYPAWSLCVLTLIFSAFHTNWNNAQCFFLIFLFLSFHLFSRDLLFLQCLHVMMRGTNELSQVCLHLTERHSLAIIFPAYHWDFRVFKKKTFCNFHCILHCRVRGSSLVGTENSEVVWSLQMPSSDPSCGQFIILHRKKTELASAKFQSQLCCAEELQGSDPSTYQGRLFLSKKKP